ncbi:flagellar export protein FliJ [Azospira inquinata]|uniref:Flagellar export protein FliJ n=1 Tax=Azospira inquinata TaxID=2785627 RepID=A0A975SL97_9RHOO|nr:flagellar export protein FliJ [Azospira inquinata]QWT46255.1 flagellar export protein FliJ [Azospira inquinata]QWT48418.1 flagellar export protein FliJ [Azospira inquinata]
MAKPFPLRPLQDLIQTRVDDAAKALGFLVASERDTKDKLAMLEDYRRDYLERFKAASQNGLTPAAWRNFQDFMDKIDAAIEQQKKSVHLSQQRTAQGQAEWLAQHNKLKAIDTLAERHMSAEQYREAKREQKQQDEFAARKSWDKNPDFT